MSSKESGAYGAAKSGPSSHLMKMKFMQRGAEAEKRKQALSEHEEQKKAADWSKDASSSVYVSFSLLPASRI